jgi:hypothetical protein
MFTAFILTLALFFSMALVINLGHSITNKELSGSNEVRPWIMIICSVSWGLFYWLTH